MATFLSSMRSRTLPAAGLLLLALCARSEADVTLQLSQPSYAVGETVSFTLTNASEFIITLPNAEGWWHVADSQGALVGGCVVIPLMLDLYPAHYLHGSWDQLLCPFGPQVPQGRYRLWVGYWSDCCPGYLSVETWFSIGLDPVAPATWGAIKAQFE